MKLTKVLREYVEEQMNKARYEANKEAKAEYVARKEKVEEEIKTYLAEVVNPHIEEILKANDMDLTAERWGDKKPASEHILQFASQYILNKEEDKALKEAEDKRCANQTKAMKKFAIECELGIDKDEFYDKVAELAKEVK
jgi:hypothetical protein